MRPIFTEMGLLILTILEFGIRITPCSSRNPIALTKTRCLVWFHSRLHHPTVLFENITETGSQIRTVTKQRYHDMLQISGKTMPGSGNFYAGWSNTTRLSIDTELLRHHFTEERVTAVLFL
ncbi:hypothetical protein AVEN_210945-1 [Araneus ventricosus]|uniref:Secreted protein n=1 Tax=Araneus ventricosus TaxID=182803 RepID=A0A4Y2DGQ1_ARAVE|nr:hypothetical protein AVEN_210945-1 [Araneus ventricosus]